MTGLQIFLLAMMLGLGIFLGWRLAVESRRVDELIAISLSGLKSPEAEEKTWDEEEWWSRR